MTHKCTCNWTAKTLGDGCRVCNPQMMIDMLLEEKQELEQRIADSDDNCYELSQRIKELESPKTCEGGKWNALEGH